MKSFKSHKIFFAMALAGIFILFLFSYLTYRPLTLDHNARETIEKFYELKRKVTIGNFVVFFILLFVSNLMYIRQRYWDTFLWAGLIFVTFTFVDWWWLMNEIADYKKANDLSFGEPGLGLFTSIMVALFGLIIAIGNYLLLKRLVKEKNIEPIVEVKIEDVPKDNEKII